MSPSALTYPAELRMFTLRMLSGASLSDVTSNRTWNVVDHSEVIGHGVACFRAASYRLNSWRAHAHARVGVEEEKRGKETGKEADNEAVLLHFGPTHSPCQILHREQTARRTVMVYGTLQGHVECGEEAFCIELRDDGTVIGRCVAFSRHAWWLARLGAPAARWVQHYETRRYVDGMQPVGRKSPKGRCAPIVAAGKRALLFLRR